MKYIIRWFKYQHALIQSFKMEDAARDLVRERRNASKEETMKLIIGLRSLGTEEAIEWAEKLDMTQRPIDQSKGKTLAELAAEAARNEQRLSWTMSPVDYYNLNRGKHE